MNDNMYVINNILIINVNEEVDHHSAKLIRKSADSIMDTMGIKDVIFDFRETKFMDSSGIGLVMGRKRKANIYGGEVVIANASNVIERIFVMSGIDKIIRIRQSLKEAVDDIVS